MRIVVGISFSKIIWFLRNIMFYNWLDQYYHLESSRRFIWTHLKRFYSNKNNKSTNLNAQMDLIWKNIWTREHYLLSHINRRYIACNSTKQLIEKCDANPFFFAVWHQQWKGRSKIYLNVHQVSCMNRWTIILYKLQNKESALYICIN